MHLPYRIKKKKKVGILYLFLFFFISHALTLQDELPSRQNRFSFQHSLEFFFEIFSRLSVELFSLLELTDKQLQR